MEKQKWLRICFNAFWPKFWVYLITHRTSLCVNLCKSALSGWALWESQKWPENLRQEHKACSLHASISCIPTIDHMSSVGCIPAIDYMSSVDWPLSRRLYCTENEKTSLVLGSGRFLSRSGSLGGFSEKSQWCRLSSGAHSQGSNLYTQITGDVGTHPSEAMDVTAFLSDSCPIRPSACPSVHPAHPCISSFFPHSNDFSSASPCLSFPCSCLLFLSFFFFQYLAPNLHLFLLKFSMAVTFQSSSLPQLCPLWSVSPQVRGPLLLKHNLNHIFIWRHAWKSGFCSAEMQTIISVWKRKAYFVHGIDICRLRSIVPTALCMRGVCPTQQEPMETHSMGRRPVTHPFGGPGSDDISSMVSPLKTFPSLINHAKVRTKLLIHRFSEVSHHQMVGKFEDFSLPQPRVECSIWRHSHVCM